MTRALPVLLLVLLISFEPRSQARLSTWTLVAVDAKTGDVGVAGATCLPDTHADAVAALVPGKGAAAVQAFWDQQNRNRVFELLRAGQQADEIIRQVTHANFDKGFSDRQYGVVTIAQGVTRVAAFTGKENLDWAGSQQDLSRGVTVQGNILVGPSVVEDALTAFQADRNDANQLWDRLMRGLEAGSAAGGDARCNNAGVKQTAATAFILVARGNDPPYAANDLDMTDQGTSKAPWLDISVPEKQYGPNPIVELRRRYDQWRHRRGAEK
jgi:uncharacterized Ntn-hydrolase superfamily protein